MLRIRSAARSAAGFPSRWARLADLECHLVGDHAATMGIGDDGPKHAKVRLNPLLDNVNRQLQVDMCVEFKAARLCHGKQAVGRR